MFSIFIRDLQGRTLCLPVQACDTVDDVKLLLEERTRIPQSAQLLTPCAWKYGSTSLSELGIGPDSTLQLSGRLRGGKGGFGSLLRGSRKSSQTDNDDAYRDLSGRRLRVVNAEKKLQEWAAAEEQRRREKHDAKEERERAKAERRVEITQVDVEAVKKEQNAVLSGLHKALESSVKAGVKRTAEAPPNWTAKKPRYESEPEGDSDSGRESESDEPAQETATGGTAVDGGSKDMLAVHKPAPVPLQEAVG